MHIISQFLFVVLFAVAIWQFTKKCRQIKRNINLGRDKKITDRKSERIKNVLLLALGQKKMFRNPLVAILHLFVYGGFIIINIEILEIILDGLLGYHRLFSGIGGLYIFLINAFEVLAFLVLASCAIFLVRRNILKVKRLVSSDLNGWPHDDANYILIAEITLMSLFLIMNSCDTILAGRGVGEYVNTPTTHFLISGVLHGLFNGLSSSALIAIERSCWWLHIIGILAFMNYLPYSKHLHIILAFPNAYYASLEPKGEMPNMPDIQKEVLMAMEPDAPAAQPELDQDGQPLPPQPFGAKDIFDLSWKNLMDAYSCTECGRCTQACPAAGTGKALSPRLIMMKTRDRVEEVGKNIQKNKTFQQDGKSLMYDYITVEELNACTTCNACVEECPVSISPLDIIFQLRRFLVMEESKAPQEWNSMFQNIENNFAPWQFSPDDRDRWMQEA
ncbi:4Fe-4S dicluster domain-containing protein [Arachidicoccus rhizosphaerae]|uniref:4Fe-4S dicluster domain-containing protein n=1 Tax=Arachidicoccus rhizosphaerae TaxID=551991 RepID=A0A1H3W0Q6_9BACT|nr:(Fe-S)-binding protein [Arachidicoccus rhizosphaerae]SDZ80501.1 4Fe-4S dicluster domain-containing protein [Arachidicoccus rhizosphaerae]